MKCSKCGIEVPGDSSFCQYCGAEMPKVTRCAYCNAELSDDMKFCAMCGKKISFDNADTPSTPTPSKKKPGGRSISKGLFVAVSCVCAVAIICACVLGYIAHYNHNTSESWKCVAADLKFEINAMEFTIDRANFEIDSLTSHLESAEEVLSNKYILIEDSPYYHTFKCPRFRLRGGSDFWLLPKGDCVDLGYTACGVCSRMS